MFRITRQLIVLSIFLFTLLVPGAAGAAPSEKLFPSFSIVGVVSNGSVTIRTYNFPAGDSFDVLMGYMGTRGLNGYWTTSLASGSGGSFTATFAVPAVLYGQRQIAIRLQSSTGSGFYAYNWFYNNSTGGTGGPGYYPPPGPGVKFFPTFRINAVVRDGSVTVVTRNLPPNDQFVVLMGPMGSRGINGIHVATFNTGSGGTQTLTFPVPAQLFGCYQIAIRMQSNQGSGYFAYNWFYNNSTY